MKPKTVGRDSSASGATTPAFSYGLMANSIILTRDGEKRVADLKEGDCIITRDAGMTVLRGFTRREVTCQTVEIKAGSLGHTRPECDVTLPAGQPILVRDWRARALFNARQAMVPAGQLIDGEYITDAGRQTLTVHDLSFDEPHILYVDGLEVASDASQATLDAAA
ncbi:hypothetical protein FDP25_02115 [Roseovarius sp. A21]|uniref:Hedgehog/Intein (Hint) domain-containing protein n=1 Tax=Roseovarius bejariae TaxID=2576383 RepID=A0A844CL68_9RHOB|nr:Hint domain-containing protein [Roseovarius bejariae]MRU14215.1 hypothetical protein [Roseovarius bejariae]